MADTDPRPDSLWRRIRRGFLNWEEDKFLAVMGGFFLVVLVGAVLALLGFVGYITWDLAPEHPLLFACLGSLLLGFVALVWLLRSRCVQCKQFFAARRTGTAVDTVPTRTVVGGIMTTGQQTVVVRYYRCRRCGVDFSRR